jgi:CRISPR type IV-associated DEAD/DEAH-box helicase Csf4
MLRKIVSEVIGHEPRPQQVTMYSNLSETVQGSKVGMVEASTGIGKTLVKLAYAVEWLTKNPNERMVIATPTKQLVKQIQSDANKIGFLAKNHLVHVIYAKNDFVSVGQLLKVVTNSSSDVQDAVHAWLDKQTEAEFPYLASSLEEAVPDFRLLELTTLSMADENEKDPGHVAYLNQFDKASKYRLIICTHAMLAYDLKIRRMVDGMSAKNAGADISFETLMAKEHQEKKKYTQLSNETVLSTLEESEIKRHCFLPAYKVAFIDEAHVFDSSVTLVLSPKCPFWMMEKNLRALSTTSGKHLILASIGKVKNVMERVLNVDEGVTELSFQELQSMSPSLSVQLFESLTELHDAIDLLKLPKKQKTKQEYRQFLSHQRALDSFLFSVKHNRATSISFSPAKKYASISSASQAPQSLLDYLYQTTDSVVMVSATLTFPEKNGRSPYRQMANKLSIPSDRLMTFEPIVSDFLYKGVRLEVTEDMVLHPVNYGGEDYELEIDAWGKSMADKIKMEHEHSPGGTLVLNTSYQSIIHIAKHLVGCPMVVAGRDFPLSSQKKEFIEKSKKGQSPIWLTIGAAWTGLDVSGKDLGLSAEMDQVITTEVITRLPIGLNKTVKASYRSNSLNFRNEAFEAYLMFRQGLGRLIRRENLPENRRIFILDPRLKTARKTILFGPLLKALEPYSSCAASSKSAISNKKVRVSQ